MPPLPLLLLMLPFLLVAFAPRAAAAAEPLDLDDRRPRAVAVRFEMSPREHPARRDALWTEPLPARLEPDAPGRVRVVVPRALVEERLFADQGVVEGSFDDFVWVFDVARGEVVSATLRGSLERPLHLGFLRFHAGVDVEVALSTRAPVAFREGRRVMGELVHAPCDALDAADCRRVAPEPYDPATGAVYAVGLVRARSGPFRSETLCPFGEAIFLEAEPDETLPRVAEAEPADEAPEAGGLPPVAAAPPDLPSSGTAAAH